MNLSSRDQGLTAREVYCRVVEEPRVERQAKLVEQLCAGRVDLQERVERLLKARENADDGLLAHVVGAWEESDTALKPRPHASTRPGNADSKTDANVIPGSPPIGARHTGQSIGPYQLQEILGEGGMGTVYRASQEAPIKREVALKIIKPELYTDEAVARFARERQSMALMEHPNIVRVFDGGEAQDGSHYLVMELIRGVPLDEYCQSKQLSIVDRLNIFVDLCRAIEHAHAKNVIHRDLKPRNILVAMMEGRPVLKVIDFGIAKSFGGQLDSQLDQTRTGQVLGTPLYQAPEQLIGNPQAIDARCDVYALGVILYKLLTDSKPIGRDVIVNAGVDGLMEKLHYQDYATPSKRVRTRENPERPHQPKPVLLDLPKNRQRALDWITLKALQAKPEDRYQSVKEMLGDVTRFLNHEPIATGPPQPFGSLRKWFYRQSAVVFACVCLVALLAYSLLQSASQTHLASRPTVEAGETANDMAAIWRETSQLQSALAAFRELDYTALQSILAEMKPNPKGTAIKPGPAVEFEQPSSLNLTKLLSDAASPTATGQLSNSSDIQAADYSPQSGRLLVATKSGEIRLYQREGGEFSSKATVVGTHPGRVDAVAISPDGQRAVSGTESIWFWDLEQGEVQSQGPHLGAGIESIVWSPDGQFVAAGSRYAMAWVGDKAGRELFRIPNNHRHESLLFSNDSKSLFVPTREGIDEYQIPTGKRLRTIDVGPLENVRVMTLAGSERRHLVVADRFEESASVIELEGGTRVGTLPFEGRYPQCMRVTGDGMTVAALFPEGRCSIMRLAETTQGTVELRRKTDFPIFEPRSLEDDERLDLHWIDPEQTLCTVGASLPSKLWGWADFQAMQIKKPPMILWDLAPGSDDELVFFPHNSHRQGDRAYYVGLRGRTDRPSGEKLSQPTGAFSRCSRDRLIASLGESFVEIVDLANGQILAKIECDGLHPKRELSLSKDGTAVAAFAGGVANVWVTRDRWKTWSHHQVEGVDFDTIIEVTDRGQSLLLNVGRAVQEIDVVTGKSVRRYDDQWDASPWKLEIDDVYGRVIIGKRGVLTILERKSGKTLHQFRIDSEVTSILSDPSPSYLITGHRDGTIRAWHLVSFQPLGALFQPTTRVGQISRLETFPDRNRILAVARENNQAIPIIVGN
ncbi:WD40 repeat domain-containing serine/threonine-protein kinase [Roseiconus lacunae]|uniref:protein kinase domain-containing protein n=1 Tax=Roseiconus lacunae TaxID=2605694 RepID=UPI003092DCE0|nr:WD40 repeat domain-containing serine/threonine-protein kinase [Stieleria sp. HD01]